MQYNSAVSTTYLWRQRCRNWSPLLQRTRTKSFARECSTTSAEGTATALFSTRWRKCRERKVRNVPRQWFTSIWSFHSDSSHLGCRTLLDMTREATSTLLSARNAAGFGGMLPRKIDHPSFYFMGDSLCNHWESNLRADPPASRGREWGSKKYCKAHFVSRVANNSLRRTSKITLNTLQFFKARNSYLQNLQGPKLILRTYSDLTKSSSVSFVALRNLGIRLSCLSKAYIDTFVVSCRR